MNTSTSIKLFCLQFLLSIFLLGLLSKIYKELITDLSFIENYMLDYVFWFGLACVTSWQVMSFDKWLDPVIKGLLSFGVGSTFVFLYHVTVVSIAELPFLDLILAMVLICQFFILFQYLVIFRHRLFGL